MGKKIIFTPEQEMEIIELYNENSSKTISKIFRVSKLVIINFLKTKNIGRLNPNRIDHCKLSVNVDYFKNIDTEEKAYWLGWICADGHISKKRYTMIKVKDREVVEKFKKATKSEHAITENNDFLKSTGKYYKKYCISITNTKFTDNLIKQGITHEKSHILEFPKIDFRFHSFFIAGLLDGDGCISEDKRSIKSRKNHKLIVKLISTKEVLEFIQNILIEKFETKRTSLCRITKNINYSNVFQISIFKDALRFLDYVYDEKFANMYLQRKYIKYLKTKEFEPKDIKSNAMQLIGQGKSYTETANILKIKRDTVYRWSKQ